MKTVTNLILTIAAVTLLAACGNTQKPAAADPHAGHNHAAEAGKGTAMADHATTPDDQSKKVSLKDDHLNAVYQHYIHLSTALTNGDMAEAKIAASAIELGAKSIRNGTALASFAAKITAAGDLEAQRIVFADLSGDFIKRIKASGLSSGELYVEYCPMALDDKGAYWVSNSKEIWNPYFGESMLNCGEVKETVK